MTDEKWGSPTGHAIASDKTDKIAQPEAAKVALDMDNAREVFENWLTADGNYPHLKHKSFGGQYLHEEAAMKWDGFKAGYYALQTPASDTPTQSPNRAVLDALKVIEKVSIKLAQCEAFASEAKDLDESILKIIASTQADEVNVIPDYVPSLVSAWSEKEADCMVERRVDTSFEIGFKAAWDLWREHLKRQKGR